MKSREGLKLQQSPRPILGRVASLSPRVAPQLVYRPAEVVQLLGTSKHIVRALLRSGRLRSVRCGRLYLIPAEALETFLAGGGPE